MGAHAQEEAQVHAQGTYVGARLTGDPEHSQVAVCVVLYQPALVHSAHSQLALDSRDEWRPLEQGTLQQAGPLLRVAL